MRAQKIYIVFLVGILMIGYNWLVDIPQTVQIPLRNQPYYFSSMEFNLMYFYIYLPIFIFSIPAGMLIGKAKHSLMALILVTISLVCTVGLWYLFYMRSNTNKSIIFLLRALFGLANEGIMTLQAVIIGKYFKKHFEFIFGVYFSLYYFIVSGTFSLSPIIYQQTQEVYKVMQFGCIFALISFIGGLLLFLKLWSLQSRIEHHVKLQKILCYNKILTQKSDQQTKSKSQISQNLSQINQNNHEDDQAQDFRLQHVNIIADPMNPFWLIVAAVVFTEISVLPFIDNLNEALVQTYNIPYLTAGSILMIQTILTAIFLIIVSYVHERFPSTKRTSYIIIACLYFSGLTLLYLLPTIENDPTPFWHYFGIIGFLIIMALNMTILWTFLYSSVIYFVDQKYLGTAYGIIGCGIGIGQCLGPLINAFWLNTTSQLSESYKSLFLYYMLISMIPIFISIWIKLNPQFDLIDEQLSQQKQQIKNSSDKQQLSKNSQVFQKMIRQQQQQLLKQQRRSNLYLYKLLLMVLIILLVLVSASIFLRTSIDKNYSTSLLLANKQRTSSHGTSIKIRSHFNIPFERGNDFQ